MIFTKYVSLFLLSSVLAAFCEEENNYTNFFAKKHSFDPFLSEEERKIKGVSIQECLSAVLKDSSISEISKQTKRIEHLSTFFIHQAKPSFLITAKEFQKIKSLIKQCDCGYFIIDQSYQKPRAIKLMSAFNSSTLFYLLHIPDECSAKNIEQISNVVASQNFKDIVKKFETNASNSK